MNERDAFIRAICENPADDTARLVFADWLDEHGEPERSAFIRVQVALAKKPVGTHRHAKECPKYGRYRTVFGKGFSPCVTCPKCRPKYLYRRQEALWNFGAPGHWVVDDPFPFANCIRCIDTETISVSLTTYDPIAIYRRGFVSGVVLSTELFLKHAIELFASHPIETVRLTDKRPLDDAGVESYFGGAPGPAENWYWLAGTMRSSLAWELPPELRSAHSPRFASEVEAGDWLSDRCVAWGREQADLPTIKHQGVSA